jgi:drug/metabolite transporter (DMT)-like permease
MSEYWIGVLCALVASFLFGLSNVVYKRYGRQVGIATISASRIWISLPIALLGLLLPIGQPGFSMSLEAALTLSFSMIIGIVVGDSFYFLSQKRLGVSRAFPLVMSYPLVVYLIAYLFLDEPLFLTRVMGAVLVVIGVGIIGHEEPAAVPTLDSNQSGNRKLGLLAAALTIVFWALGDVTIQIGLVSADPVDGNAIRMIVASIIMIPLFPQTTREVKALTTKQATGFLLAGMLGIGVSLFLAMFSIKFIGATVTSILVATAPLSATPMAMLALDEDVGPRVYLATGMIVIGVVLVLLAV